MSIVKNVEETSYGKEVICIFQTTEKYFILCSRLELEFVYLRFHSFQLQKTSEQ